MLVATTWCAGPYLSTNARSEDAAAGLLTTVRRAASMSCMVAGVQDITDALLAFGRTLDPWRLIPSLKDEASRLVYEDPFAFLLGASLDRGIPAEVAWTFPLWIRERLGHLDPARICELSADDLARVLQACPRRPRYSRAAPRTIKEMATLVMTEGGGDARRIWNGRRAADVRRLLMRVHGIGDGIASMVLALLDRIFRVPFDDLDRKTMDVKADVHVIRVLTRLGVLDPRRSAPSAQECRWKPQQGTGGDALAVTRSMYPDHPALLDAPLWMIGRNWCFAGSPRCTVCPLTAVCAKRDT